MSQGAENIPVMSNSRPLRTERDVIETLAGSTVTLEEIYAACEAAGVTDRDDGSTVVHSRTDTRWRRRARNALQHLRAAGRAEALGDGVWVIDGSKEQPLRALLVLFDEESDIEVALGRAEHLLAETDEQFDLVFADPPWGMERDKGELRQYERGSEQVVGGYIEVDPADYAEFTERWLTAAVPAIRPGGYLAIITGPQQAARVQVAAEDAGLTYLNSIAVRRPFALRSTRRFAHAHWKITLLTNGSRRSTRRFFATPQSLPRASSGREYPLDVWDDVPVHRRTGLLRYDNELPPLLVERVIEATTAGPENGGAPWESIVADPFMGSGTALRTAIEMRRRYRGFDANCEAVRFALARALESIGRRGLLVASA